MPLRRGFKAESERRAVALWQELDQPFDQPFDLDRCVDSIGGRIVMADRLVPRARLEQLEEIQPFGFSACTFEVDDKPVFVLNPLRGLGRQRADCAHEVSHVLLRHEMRVPERLGNSVFFVGNSDQEDEASWLAGCLLLPRQAVTKAAFAGMDAKAVAEHFQTTLEMARFRMNATGATLQAGRRKGMAQRRAG